ncbi:hypothetical protein FRB93_002061 [Tulasnella sp. JGI-2019a]|nr:hypothetical protein FRB93_002061 [Tulasnella sp. JGI-2019a]
MDSSGDYGAYYATAGLGRLSLTSTSSELNFTGTSGVECEHFIQAIRRKAFSEGKYKDDEWIANFVACCVTGAALRWHVRLPAEVRDSWDRLQHALLDEYCASSYRTSEPKSLAPAAAPPPYVIPLSTGNNSRLQPRLGVIRVFTTDVPLYLSQEPKVAGRLTLTKNLYEALYVCFCPSSEPQNIFIPVSQHIINSDRYFRLLLQWSTTTNARTSPYSVLGIAQDDEDWFALCFANPDDGEGLLRTSYRTCIHGMISMSAKSTVWTIFSDDTVRATYQDQPLTAMVIKDCRPMCHDPDRIALVKDVDEHRNRYAGLSGNMYLQARLAFQTV